MGERAISAEDNVARAPSGLPSRAMAAPGLGVSTRLWPRTASSRMGCLLKKASANGAALSQEKLKTGLFLERETTSSLPLAEKEKSLPMRVGSGCQRIVRAGTTFTVMDEVDWLRLKPVCVESSRNMDPSVNSFPWSDEVSPPVASLRRRRTRGRPRNRSRPRKSRPCGSNALHESSTWNIWSSSALAPYSTSHRRRTISAVGSLSKAKNARYRAYESRACLCHKWGNRCAE